MKLQIIFFVTISEIKSQTTENLPLYDDEGAETTTLDTTTVEFTTSSGWSTSGSTTTSFVSVSTTEPFTTEKNNFETTETTLEPTTTTVSTTTTATKTTTTESATTTIEVSTSKSFQESTNFARRNSLLGDYSVQCNNKRLCIYVNKQFLRDNDVRDDEVDSFFLSEGAANDLTGFTCGNENITVEESIDRTGYLQFCSYPLDDGSWSCGTTFQQNDTHFIYENNVFYRRNSNFAIGINGTCTTEREMFVSDEIGVIINKPKFITMTIPELRNNSSFPVGMFLYQDRDLSWSSVYQQPPFFDLGLNENEVNYMYIAIRHLQPFAGASVQVLRLWGTPTADQGDSTFYEIVVDQCKQWVNDNPTFEIDGFENGAGNTVRYSVPVFAFQNAQEVYLHASVRICFEDGNSVVCTKTCISENTGYRRRRSITSLEDESETITWGPIHIVRPRAESEIGEATLKLANEEESISSEVKLIIVVAIGTACVLVLGVILGVLLKRSIQRKEFS